MPIRPVGAHRSDAGDLLSVRRRADCDPAALDDRSIRKALRSLKEELEGVPKDPQGRFASIFHLAVAVSLAAGEPPLSSARSADSEELWRVLMNPSNKLSPRARQFYSEELYRLTKGPC